jgi:hypothetical protein
MSNPIVTEFNVETQETISREMTDEEYSQYLVDKEFFDARAAEQAAIKAEKDAAKAAVHEKLSEMGITPELIEVIKKL